VNNSLTCKIWGFHSSDYEDLKTQFVPHRKHYVSAIESSRLILCKISRFHDGDYVECRLLRYVPCGCCISLQIRISELISKQCVVYSVNFLTGPNVNLISSQKWCMLTSHAPTVLLLNMLKTEERHTKRICSVTTHLIKMKILIEESYWLCTALLQRETFLVRN
jgi:hypothetical protein